MWRGRRQRGREDTARENGCRWPLNTIAAMDAGDRVTERFVDLPGLRMHIREAGEGEPILLLHGFPESSREYARVIPLLAGRARVIVPDLRGAGATDAPAGRYDLATMRGDLVALMDALGVERASIVAHDWSALAGFSLCLEHPDRVSRYVAIAVPPPYIRMSPPLLWAMPKAMRYLWFQYALAAPGLGPRLLAGGQQRLATWILRFFEVRPIPDEDVAAYLAVLREPARARAGSALYRQLIIPEFMRIMRGSYRGRRLRVPTLVLFGAEDQLIPKDAIRFHEDDAPGLQLEFVPGGAHYLVDDQPEAVAHRVAAFLAA
jgi:pimeloyl-ACP methyl ester carboxylesterase